jgi:hypothetical protein
VNRRLLAAGMAALLVLSGCANEDEEPAPPIGGDEADEPDNTDETPEDEPEDEAEEVDVTEVPDEITEEYVEAVLAELEQIRRDAIAEYRENDEFTIEVADMTQSVFTPDEVQHEREDLDRIAESGFEGVKPVDELEPVSAEVLEIHSSTDVCIVVETMVDFEGLLIEPPDPRERIYHLVTQDRELVEDYNPTPWVIAGTPADLDRWREEDPC